MRTYKPTFVLRPSHYKALSDGVDYEFEPRLSTHVFQVLSLREWRSQT